MSGRCNTGFDASGFWIGSLAMAIRLGGARSKSGLVARVTRAARARHGDAAKHGGRCGAQACHVSARHATGHARGQVAARRREQ